MLLLIKCDTSVTLAACNAKKNNLKVRGKKKIDFGYVFGVWIMVL